MVMFLYKLPDETPANRKMAKQIVERWSRPIFDSHRDTRCFHAAQSLVFAASSNSVHANLCGHGIGFMHKYAHPRRDEEREAQRVDELRRDARRRQEAAMTAQDEHAEERKVRKPRSAQPHAECYPKLQG